MKQYCGSVDYISESKDYLFSIDWVDAERIEFTYRGLDLKRYVAAIPKGKFRQINIMTPACMYTIKPDDYIAHSQTADSYTVVAHYSELREPEPTVLRDPPFVPSHMSGYVDDDGAVGVWF